MKFSFHFFDDLTSYKFLSFPRRRESSTMTRLQPNIGRYAVYLLDARQGEAYGHDRIMIDNLSITALPNAC